uniref:Putative piggybac transposable element-derived n=1 Tax=Ixodes ricinus TaxID=34613 RepID=A0A0K8RFP4_IXORI
MHYFVIYEGKGTATNHELGISGDIVRDLVRDLPQGINHKVFFDNWFSSLRLVDHLKKRATCQGELSGQTELKNAPWL